MPNTARIPTIDIDTAAADAERLADAERRTADLHDDIRRLVQDRELGALARLLRAMAPADLVAVIEDAPADDAAIVFRLLGKDDSIAVFDALDSGSQAALVEEFGQAQIAEVFGALDPEEQAWLLDEVPAKVANRLIAAFRGGELDAAMSLLGYRAGSLGRRMSPPALIASEGESLGALLARVRSHPASAEMLAQLPVTGHDRTLVGVVDLPAVLVGDADAPVASIMQADVALARTEDDAEQVARRVLDDGVLVLPVVDRERRLVGVFPIADAARVDRAAVEEDQARAGASEPLRRRYLSTTVRSIARSRIVWLLVLAVSAILTVQVLDIFQATLEQKVALSLFVPLLIGIGGNTGSQAATTVTRALAVGDVDLRDIGRVAFKEVRTGLLLGATLAVIAFAVASLVYGTDIGTVIALTLVVNCPIAATVGGAIPLAARACRVDPAVFSTPFISTFCDASGLLIYFTIAIAVLRL